MRTTISSPSLGLLLTLSLSQLHSVVAHGDPLFSGVDGVTPPADTGYDECLSIDSSKICAPWSSGLKINATSLSEVYGLENQMITNSSFWAELVEATTSGGSLQGSIWSEYLQCPYKGEPIQYFRSYVCLTDIFHYSAGCNPTVKTLSPALHTDVCDVYGIALKGLVESCPTLEALVDQKNFDENTLAEIYQRREAVLTAKDSCRELLEQYKGDGAEVWGVEGDQITCGFASNADVGKQYCDDVYAQFGQTPKCCDSIEGYTNDSSPPKVQSLEKSQKISSLHAQGLEGDGSESAADITGPVVGGIAGGVAFIVMVVGAVVGYRRRTTSRNSNSTGRIVIDDDGSMERILTPGKDDGSLERKETRMAPGTRRNVFHEYSADLHDEIDLKVGDIVEIESTFTDGWCRGKNLSTGRVGMFPSGVVEW